VNQGIVQPWPDPVLTSVEMVKNRLVQVPAMMEIQGMETDVAPPVLWSMGGVVLEVAQESKIPVIQWSE
jgi:hypothetical protein